MKAERRHELKHNELADWLVERTDAARPHAAGIALGIGILALLVLGGVWYFGGERSATASAWSSYFSAFNDREPQKSLASVTASYSGSKAAWWALMSIGDMSLGDGAALLYTDREQAKTLLDKAAEAYKQVELSDDPVLKTRARLGLAKVYESKCEPEAARKYYEMVAESEKDTAIGKAAAANAKRMKDSRDVAFLEWFAQQTPKKPAPLPGIGGAVPGLPPSLPERPDISGPTGATGTGLGEIGTGAPPAPALSFPAPATETTTPPQATTPPATAPPAATPPEDAKPAEPKSGEQPKSGDQ